MSFVYSALDLRAAGDANTACLESTIVSANAATAPNGAVHWWLRADHSSGHVGVGYGGSNVLMTDAPPADQWHGYNTVGMTTVERYKAKGTAYIYVGWSLDVAGQLLITSGTSGSGTPIVEPVRNKNMSSLYYKQDTSPTLYAFAGDSPGTAANWLETTDQTLANGWSAQIGGPSIPLSAGTFDNYKALYLAPLAVSGSVTGGGDNSVLNAVAGVATQVTNLDTKVTRFPTPPTALENGQAARNAIVK